MKNLIFIEAKHAGATLGSIGLVSSRGMFYAEFIDSNNAPLELGYMEENSSVLISSNSKKPITNVRGTKSYVSNKLVEWLSVFDDVEMWLDMSPHGWVLFCDLFGGSDKLPSNVCHTPMDVNTLFAILPGVEDAHKIDRYEYANIDVEENKGNALYDARVIKVCYLKLTCELQIDKKMAY